MPTNRDSLPFVFINAAITADGKLASDNRHIPSPGSKRDQEHMMELRALADAVLIGARTADMNPVHLGPGGEKFRKLRLQHGLSEYNLRIIVSGSGTVSPSAKIFQLRFSPIIVLTTERITGKRRKALEQVAEVKVCGRTEIDFRSAFRWLRKRWNVRRLLSEGSGAVNDPLFRAGLINELHLTICPYIFGGRHAPTLSDGTGVAKLADAYQMKLKSMEHIGDELFLIYRRR
jgi:2,5-diamino-6-(ribosylamino)-4(3H)-pyrimidinone 5'-phosphate reductase